MLARRDAKWKCVLFQTLILCSLFLVRPQFVSQPNDQIVLEGQNVTFPCIATGVPQPSISWWFNNEKLHAKTTRDGNLTVYVVKNNEEFEGNYTCKANSKAGIDEETAWLTVDGKLYLLRSVACTVKPILILNNYPAKSRGISPDT